MYVCMYVCTHPEFLPVLDPRRYLLINNSSHVTLCLHLHYSADPPHPSIRGGERARDMYKNAHKVEWKTRSKISCHYTWLLHRKNCPLRWRFLRSFLTNLILRVSLLCLPWSLVLPTTKEGREERPWERGCFLTPSKSSTRSITAAKRKEEEKRERRKKNSKIKKPNDLGHFLLQKLWFLRVPESECHKTQCLWWDPQCKCIFDLIEANLAKMQPPNRQNVQQKAPKVNG